MADEMPVNQASIDDIDEKKFRVYFEKLRNRTIEEEGLSYENDIGKMSTVTLLTNCKELSRTDDQIR